MEFGGLWSFKREVGTCFHPSPGDDLQLMSICKWNLVFSKGESHWGNKLLLRVGYLPSSRCQQETNSVVPLEVPCLIMSCQGFPLLSKILS